VRRSLTGRGAACMLSLVPRIPGAADDATPDPD
jgi:hypothetical protein